MIHFSHCGHLAAALNVNDFPNTRRRHITGNIVMIFRGRGGRRRLEEMIGRHKPAPRSVRLHQWCKATQTNQLDTVFATQPGKFKSNKQSGRSTAPKIRRTL